MKKLFKTLLLSVLLLLGAADTMAQLSSLEVGQIYRFKSARADRSLAADGIDDVHVKSTDANDKKQEWYVTKDGDYYVLRNVACGKYLKGAPSSYTAWGMTDDYSANENKFQLLVSNSTLNTLKTNGSDNYGHMHDDNNGDNGGYNVVGWLNGNENVGSHWTITKVDYTAEQIKTLLDAAPTTAEIAAFSGAIAAIFKDGACTVLKDDYASMSVEDIKADANYIALPAALQKTILKIRNDSWAEDNANSSKDGWNGTYAKKFRVQMYEPYSFAGDITSWLGISSHANNDNPTGIYMPAAGTLYVMVEGEIEEGATLSIVDGYTSRRIFGNTTESAVALQRGLNVINYTGSTGMLYICYNVDTYNPAGTDDATRFHHKLSDYAPLKIHIEGGAINGYYNACGDFRATTDADNLWKTISGASVDKDADWEYMETRANLSVLPILGHREILLLQLEDESGSPGLRNLLPEKIECPSTPYSYAESWSDYGMGCDPSTGKINIVMEAWDRIFYSQLATMGLVGNSQMDRINSLYPRWTKDGTPAEMYDYDNKSKIDNKTYLEFCGIDYSDYFNHHGVVVGTGGGNPYGGGDHVGYPIGGFADVVYKLPNTAGSTWGPAHEIGHQHQALLTLNGLIEVTNNLFANVALWYKGMSTSRYNGSDGSLESVLNAFNTNGSDIYTNNIWALTHLYYRLWLYYHLAGNNTQFYPRLFELLRHNPMVGGANVSGDTSTLHFYKLACQAAGEDLTEFFRVHGYFSVMEDRFVGDYSNSTYNVSQDMIDEAIAEVKGMGYPENLSIIFINDDDETATYLQHDGETAREIYGETKPNSEFGSVSDFIAGNVSVETTYTATLNSDGTITMSGGEGGVGFLILNEKGEVISFSNKSTFALGDEAMEAIVSGDATIMAVDSENNVVEAESSILALQKGALATMIADAQSVIDKKDDTYTKIGYFRPTAVTDLENALDYAKEVYAASSGYEAAYDLLYAEYTKVLENKDAKIPFNPSLTYIIKNKAYSSETMWVNGSGVVRSEGGVDQTSNDARWKFVETSTAGVYNICTLNNKYIPAVQQSASMNATSDKADNNALYTLEEVADGVWAIKLSPAAGYRNLHSSWNNVVGWETGADASRWYLTAVAADPVIADLTNLEVYINKTEQLLDEVVGAVTYTKGTPLSLQTTTQNSAGYLWSNAPEDSEGSINYLVDGITGNKNNYFHTDWSSEPASGSHYLAVDLGDNTLSSFTFSHTTRTDAGDDFPKSVDVYGSNDNVTYKYIGSASKMPQSSNTAWEFDGVMLSSYRYLRFNYHANRGYWHMAEFDITPITGFTATVNDTYNSTVTVDAVTAAMNALFNGKRTANGISPTTDDVNAKLQALESAYNTLYEQYKATIDARKATLATLVAQTETLISQVGEVELAKETPVTLTIDNFYCNAPYIQTQNADYSADYVTKLTDGNVGTYLHTRWNANSDDGDYHYLRVDAGTPIDLFHFTYTTASRGKKDMPLTIVVEGANEIDADNSTKDTFTEIATLTPLPEVLNTNTVYKSSVLGSAGTKYRYLRFKVTDITVEESDGNGHPFFTMSEFGLTSVTEENVTVNNAYKSCVSDELLLTTLLVTNSSSSMSSNELVTSVPLLDAQIADQTAKKLILEEAMAQQSGLDKTALRELIADMQSLLGEVADKTTAETPVALQTTDANADFYIWSNATASDCDGIAALIDKNDDGTAKTGTFFGTVWQGGAVANYSHYIEIDLGTDIALSELSFDYTTRNSTHSDQRPTSIKILGSTDKDKYEEVTTISEGLPTGQNQKWELTSPLTLNKYYRYLRFEVATQKGYFNMSDFNLYAPNAMSLNEIYMQSSLTAEQLFVISSALQNAISVADKNVTTDIYNSTLATLQEQYDLLLDVKNSNVTNKEELKELIDITKTLVESAAIIDENEAKIALQCNDANAPYYIYCNAPGASNNYGGDYSGVAAMLDVDENGEPINSTHLHTTYYGNSYDDDLDHYLRVDMGENVALESFKFAYISRAGNTNNSPTKILVEGCNDLEKGDFEEIATITGANMSAVSYQSGVITNGKAYRYVRLMVKETFMNDMYNGHPFFVLSHFEMTACKTVTLKDEFASPNLSISTLLDANNKMVDANVVKNKLYVARPVYDSTLGELQAAYNALNLAKQLKDIPVVITTDVNKPVLYKIKINRDGDKCLQYDEASGKVDVSDVRLNRAQAWYFMSGDDATKDVLIIPYKSEETVLATNSFSEGAGKVDAVGASTAGYSYNWQITKVTDSEWYNITILDGNETTFYFSNYGGASEKMGFYNVSSDGGSQFQFILDETDYSVPDSYYELYNLQQECGGEKTAGENIGQYTQETASAFNRVNSDAKTLLDDTTQPEDKYADVYNRLQETFNALKVNLPEERAYYRIRSACSQADRNGRIIYVNSENKPHFDAPDDENLSNYIWQFEVNGDGYSLKNLHTQCYVNSAPWATQVVLAASPQKITIDVLDNGVNGQVRLNVSGSYPLHAQAYNSMLVGYTGDAGSASAWYIEEVADVAAVHYPYTLSAIGYGTLMLGFDAVIPEGVEAYWAESVDGIYAHMEPIADVLPANTAVILKSEAELDAALPLTFKYSAVSGTPVGDNMLAGTLYKRVVKCDTDDVDNKVYVMQAKNGDVKMYCAYENYGADGKRDDTNGGQNDNGGHIMNSANRAYLVVPQLQAQQTAFNFRFGAFTDVETAVDDCESVEAIYDLQGRKVANPTKGIYIINGRKVVVK